MKNHEVGGGQNYDSGWEDLARERLNERLERRSQQNAKIGHAAIKISETETMSEFFDRIGRSSQENAKKKVEQDRPNGVKEKIIEVVTEPNMAGILGAAGVFALMTLDVALNNTSGVTPQAEAMIAGFAAAAGFASKRGAQIVGANEEKEKQANKRKEWMEDKKL